MGTKTKQLVPMKFGIKKGDTVQIMSGKDAGKKGKVLKCLPQEHRVIVEGLNRLKKHSRPTQRNPQSGGIIEIEAPVHISNIMLVCPSCGQTSRLGFERTDDGKRLRICKKCSGKIDKK
jgi:large subunit ribosomal protein L24